MTPRALLRLGLGIGLTGLFLWLALHGVDWDQLRATFARSHGGWIVAASCAFLAGYACRIARWHLLLRHENPRLRWIDCAGPLMASVAANNVLPLRAGDLLRAWGFNQRLGISATVSVTTLLLERLLDLMMMILVLGAALRGFNTDVSSLLGMGGASLLALGVGIAGALCFPSLYMTPIGWLMAWTEPWSPTIGARLRGISNQASSLLAQAADRRTMAQLMLWSLLAWLAEGLVFWWAALALPDLTHPQIAWLALPTGTLATAIPSLPGYVGTFDYFTAQVMTRLGNPAVAATAYALLVHVLLWLPPVVVGGPYLLMHSLRTRPHP